MTVLNELDRFHLALDVIRRVAAFRDSTEAEAVVLICHALLAENRRHTREHGEDLPEIRNWKWNPAAVRGSRASI